MNLCIEYDGEQHFIKTNNWYSGIVFQRDQAKNKWALEHEVNFLRISYILSQEALLDIINNLDSLKKMSLKYELYYITDESFEILNEENYYAKTG